MPDAVLPFTLLLSLGTTLVSAAGLRAWQQWLDLKRTELVRRNAAGTRSEIGALRTRVRRLEALANGIEL